ncbi:hypothetical protein PL9214291207 [Planktothrix tepida PCC 9214]|uniref:Uncharacterized protein n=1 Tax=Planktothrix tepida PCC 9214 TaxID=671072 RepID=A0A1J1LGL4_9CYAN|nr:hypothetical protein PL9214291207 [Planktothrix tepida PCC 9214]
MCTTLNLRTLLFWLYCKKLFNVTLQINTSCYTFMELFKVFYHFISIYPPKSPLKRET